MNSTSGMSIGQRIALYRRLRGLTQEGLAMRLHRSKSWVTKVERGERQIDSVTALLQVSKALGVEVQKLTCDTRSHGTSELTDWRIGNVDDSELRRSVRDPSPP